MSVQFNVPTPLRSFVGGHNSLLIDANSVGDTLNHIELKYPGFKQRICDKEGELRKFINVFLNDEDIRYLDCLATPVKSGDTLSVIPAVAGGSGQTFQSLLSLAKEQVPELNPVELKSRIDSKEPLTLLDVREGEEFRQGYIPGSINVPRGFLELQVESKIPDKQSPIALYCAGGTRSLLAGLTLKKMGYQFIISLAGGFNGWAKESLPVTIPKVLSEKERKRYNRHLKIPEIGEEGQLKLLNSKVLLIGTGGLGCPNAYYLAAAGVGTLGLVDFDVVDESNLQRQILHTADRVGQPKVKSAIQTLSGFNPDLKIIPFEERLTSSNVERIFADFDVIVDGSDNFPTRYLVNDACVKLGKPCVHGSVFRFEGQVSVFDPSDEAPCYRCLYPEPPPPSLAPSCAEAGVLGVLPGVIGLLEAIETIKHITGIGTPLKGRLLTFDALETKFKEFKIRKNPHCSYCASKEGFPGYVDYEQLCSVEAN
ncbi:MAG: molybdopterin-synthase adenylyltransferase MoeB [Oligoflexales bacterium]|nr:molybdopterin-synthase adenylyltransferase MoeB [Oligoflexales bacterium]